MRQRISGLLREGLALAFLSALVAGLVTPWAAPAASAQAKPGFGGSWEWLSRPDRRKGQTAFWVYIRQKGRRVSGTISFAMLVDGENDGADSSSIPFVGTVRGDAATIEFDPKDFHTIEDENPVYKRPRSPSTATLRLKDGKLEWTQTKGVLDDLKLGVPNSFVMTRQ